MVLIWYILIFTGLYLYPNRLPEGSGKRSDVFISCLANWCRLIDSNSCVNDVVSEMNEGPSAGRGYGFGDSGEIATDLEVRLLWYFSTERGTCEGWSSMSMQCKFQHIGRVLLYLDQYDFGWGSGMSHTFSFSGLVPLPGTLFSYLEWWPPYRLWILD